jgi:glycosyl transferase family 25
MINKSVPEIQVLVISLENSFKRRAVVTHQLNQTTWAWRFLDAIRGATLSKLPPEYRPKKVNRLLGHELTASELGCFLSHKKAWQVCVDTNIPTIILEDDFQLLPNFEAMIQFLMSHFEKWEMVRLHGLFEVPQKPILTEFDLSLLQNQGDAVGATAYLVKPVTAQKLIQESDEIYQPLDHFLEHQKKHGIVFLSVKPYPVGITGAESTIQDRPGRNPILGIAKIKRSFYRILDRWFTKKPWFPK